ncbi:MAG TPA: hypothetical protein DEF06_02510 [Clostridiales bacterium]|nr:hypothetical protein [Clostridiales bacterium]
MYLLFLFFLWAGTRRQEQKRTSAVDCRIIKSHVQIREAVRGWSRRTAQQSIVCIDLKDIGFENTFCSVAENEEKFHILRACILQLYRQK